MKTITFKNGTTAKLIPSKTVNGVVYSLIQFPDGSEKCVTARWLEKRVLVTCEVCGGTGHDPEFCGPDDEDEVEDGCPGCGRVDCKLYAENCIG